MTILYPDLSQYTPVPIASGTSAVVCRATLSDSVIDTYYNNCRQQCASKNVPFAAYHWMNHGNIHSQILWAFLHVGSVPLMLDCEDMPGNTGYNGPITIQDILEFVTLYRAIGGTCNVNYIPHWYWQDHMGSPSLLPLRDIGMHMVSSNYVSLYTDNGPGWAPYGNVTPDFWQYTDKFSYGGMLVDYNAFKGTADQWWKIFSDRQVLTMGQPINTDHLEQDWQVLSDAWVESQKAGENPPRSIGKQVWDIGQAIKTLSSATPTVTISDADRQLMTDFISAVNTLTSHLK